MKAGGVVRGDVIAVIATVFRSEQKMLLGTNPRKVMMMTSGTGKPLRRS